MLLGAEKHFFLREKEGGVDGFGESERVDGAACNAQEAGGDGALSGGEVRVLGLEGEQGGVECGGIAEAVGGEGLEQGGRNAGGLAFDDGLSVVSGEGEGDGFHAVAGQEGEVLDAIPVEAAAGPEFADALADFEEFWGVAVAQGEFVDFFEHFDLISGAGLGDAFVGADGEGVEALLFGDLSG